mmetsp:Transcript_4066/g.12215  ORF Transcript_4066/g.12215 Transcript_4066/m.12215 type:complete len:123 (-) Transcript_4066:566-934(-)
MQPGVRLLRSPRPRDLPEEVWRVRTLSDADAHSDPDSDAHSNTNTYPVHGHAEQLYAARQERRVCVPSLREEELRGVLRTLPRNASSDTHSDRDRDSDSDSDSNSDSDSYTELREQAPTRPV